MSATILQFQPKARSGDPDYYRDCALTGSPASPDKARLGMPGIILTADGDLLHAPSCDLVMDHVDTAPSEWVAPESDPA